MPGVFVNVMKRKTISPTEAWYREGLRFSCQRCGACCTGEPGYVYLRRGEAAAIAGFLGISEEEFALAYTRRAGFCASLTEEEDGRCVFFVDRRCVIYTVRPHQCRTFPFWPALLASPKDWEEGARECPGMGTGPLHSCRSIEDRMAGRRSR
jgi:Fe-S-cluster containining protein